MNRVTDLEGYNARGLKKKGFILFSVFYLPPPYENTDILYYVFISFNTNCSKLWHILSIILDSWPLDNTAVE